MTTGPDPQVETVEVEPDADVVRKAMEHAAEERKAQQSRERAVRKAAAAQSPVKAVPTAKAAKPKPKPAAKPKAKPLERIEPKVLQALFDELGLTRKQVAEALGVTVSRVAEGASTSDKMRARSRWSVPIWTKAQPILKAYARKHRTKT